MKFDTAPGGSGDLSVEQLERLFPPEKIAELAAYQAHHENVMRWSRRERWLRVVRQNAGARSTRPMRQTRPVIHMRAREQRPTARRTARSASRGEPSDQSDDPPRPLAAAVGRVEDSRDTDLNVVWRSALDRFETAQEFRALARLAAIRARLLRDWWAVS